MDKSIPTPAAMLLDFIGSTEAPKGYDTIFGNNQSKLKTPITTWTLDQLIKRQSDFTRRYGSSASGRYQFMKATLQGLRKPGGLSGSEIFNANLQDRLGYILLLRRGYLDFMAGRIDRVEFGKRLAMEWASFPVLEACKGAHRSVQRGQSYYAGDGMNKALVPAAKVEQVLALMKRAQEPASAPKPVPAPEPAPQPQTRPTVKSAGFWARLFAIIGMILKGRRS